MLEYPEPRDGQPFPADEHANDRVHRETMLLTWDAEAVGQRLRGTTNFVSLGVVVNPNKELGFTKAWPVRDPVGNAVDIEQKQG